MLANHYALLLDSHSLLRWLVLLAGVAVLVGSLIGIAGKKPFKPLGRTLGLIYVSLLDTQFLIGVLLCIASPIVHSVWANPAVSMKIHNLRFFAVEHPTGMILALIIAHIGAVLSKKAKEDQAAYTTALLWYAISFVVILLSIPWWRPFIRLY